MDVHYINLKMVRFIRGSKVRSRGPGVMIAYSYYKNLIVDSVIPSNIFTELSNEYGSGSGSRLIKSPN